MRIISIARTYKAPLLAALGIAFLVLAMPVTRQLPLWYAQSATMYAVLGWLAAMVWVVWRCHRDGVGRNHIARGVLVALLFLFTLVPIKTPGYLMLDFTLSALGFFLMLYGALLWKGLYPFFARIGRWRGPRHYVLLYFLVFLAMALGLSWHCFEFIPGYGDSISQYVQGKFIARGELYGQAPEYPRFFHVWMMVRDGMKWYAQYQPLHVMMLGAGHFIGAPWLVNPLEGALTVILICLITRRVFGETTARIAGALALVCPYMLFMSAEFMNHSTALLFTTLLIYSYIEMLEALPRDKRAARQWALVAGLSVGAVFATRPLTAIGVGLPFAVHALVMLRRDVRLVIAPLCMMAVAALACLALDLWYNQLTTGDYLIFPSGKYYRSSNISAMGYNGTFTISGVLLKAQDEWLRLNFRFFEWRFPASAFLALWCAGGIRSRYTWLLLGVILSHTLVNMGNQFNSATFGPRYLYEITSAFIILSAAGLVQLSRWLQHAANKDVVNGAIACMIGVLVIIVLATRLPVLLRYYGHFFNNDPAFYHAMLDQSEKPALIFIGRGTDNPKRKYQAVAFTNPPRDDSDVIFAIDRGNVKNRRLLNAYPQRHSYIERDGTLIPYMGENP